MITKLTHRRQSQDLNDLHVMLFTEDEKNHAYGDHVWTLKTELPEVSEDVIEYAAEFFGIDIEEARELCNPENIVGSAGAWDEPQFVSEVYQFCGEPTGFRTPDGAVILDRENAEISYRKE